MLLNTIRDILTVAAPLAITLGVFIAIFQLRNQSRLRQIDTVMRLFSSFGQETFLGHYLRVTTWNFDSYKTFQEKATEEDRISLMVVTSFFESMGLLYKRNLATLDLLDDLLSGPLLAAWASTRPIWIGMRAHYDQAQWAEWFEFLHDAMVHRLVKLEGKH